MPEMLGFSACRAQLWLPQEPVRALVYAPADEDMAEELVPLLAPEIALVALSGTDWNRDFSPWAAPAVFRGGDFTGGGPAFLQALLTEVLPAVEARVTAQKRVLAGYSLAGLFAVWAAMQTDAFDGAASASGSVWFDGFLDYAQTHPCRAGRIYLSVGDREKHTKNPRMQRVEDANRALCALLAERETAAFFELNPGNHFQQAAQRLAKGVNWLCGAWD